MPNFKNCLGYISRLRGQSRVPEPPARIIDFMPVISSKILIKMDVLRVSYWKYI